MTSGGATGMRGLARAAATAAAIAGGVAGAAAFPIGSEARAETGAWAESAHAKVRLVAAVAAIGGSQRVQLGLEIKLAPGWKTYWRAPGEGGLPPRFDWGGSANVASVAVAWPAPKRFEIGGMESVGYSDHVILPLEVAPEKPGEPLALRLALHYAVCREICMLVEAKLALDLPARAAQPGDPSTNADAIARFQARVPRPGAEHGWRIAGMSRKEMGTGDEKREIIVVDIANDGAPLAAPMLLIEGAGLRIGKAMLKPTPAAGQIRFAAPMHRVSAAPADNQLVLTLIDGERAGTFMLAAPR